MGINYGVLHTHTENSLKDSALRVEDLVEISAKLGAPAVALTDHGTLTGIEEFLLAAKKFNIKPIPGVEAYYEEDGDSFSKRAHLILMAKDEIGYTAICKAVTASNHRLDSQGIPRMNLDILRENFGAGSNGHGHVIATSACMSGILAVIVLENMYIKNEIEKTQKKRDKYRSPEGVQYVALLKKIELIDAEIDNISEKIKALRIIEKKPYTKKEKALKALEGTPDYDTALAALLAEKKESEEAPAKIAELTEAKKKKMADRKELKKKASDEEKDHDKWSKYDEEIKKLLASQTSEENLFERAIAVAKQFVGIFGEGNFYVELQNHRIPEEIECMPKVLKIADSLGLPICAANDVHIGTNSENDIKARQIMRSLRFNKWEPIFESDKELYVKTDEELSAILSEIFPMEVVERAMRGIGDIVAACNYVPSKENHFPVFPAEIPGETADEALRRKAYEGIEWRYPNKEGWTKAHEERLEYELGVIAKMGYSDYHCIVQDFLNYGRMLGKIDLNDPRYLADPYNKELIKELGKDNVGCSIGPGRGSAVGSLVCYLTGITSIDPIEYNLIFERFLNVERVSMPDIDSDFRPDIRGKVLDYVKHTYGENAVACIMTRGKQMAKAAVRNCARLLGDELYGDTRYFLSLGDEIAKAIPNELGIKLSDCVDDLKAAFSDNKYAMTIIDNAMLVEGTFTNIGMHAAGVIIADNHDVSDYVPLMYISGTEQFATQCDKDQCEPMGLLKMDFLGLRNLGIINECLHLVEKRTGRKIDIEKVPFESEVFEQIYSTGNTNSVFQFESSGMKQMLRQFKPESIEDIILLVAAYRPGPMQYLNDIISVKHGRQVPEYVIPEMADVLSTTYGYPVYQEQIMQIFNKFAGFSLGESDIIRRYMSKKKTDKFMAYKDKFVEGMIARGGQPEKVESFWNQLVDFSKYAFNKSHAAAYAFVSYYTAWLKYHFPKEYLCAVMNDTVFEKIGGLVGDCRGFGIKVVSPSVNLSQEDFSVNNDVIIYGLSKIKNVGNAAEVILNERNMNGEFSSFADFIIRTRAKKDAVESLVQAGAFDEFISNRTALLESFPEFLTLIKKIKDKEKKLETETDETKIAKINESIAALKAEINAISFNEYEDEEQFARLNAEKEVLGAYVSAHPVDSYEKPAALKCTPINMLAKADGVSVMGLISNLRIVNRKSDNAPMAFFTIEDQTGSIDVCCFTKSYANNKDAIRADTVVKISGSCVEKTDDFNDETVLNIYADKVEVLQAMKKRIILTVNNIVDWECNVKEKLKVFLYKNGYALSIYDKMTGQIRRVKDICVSSEILKSPDFDCKIAP